MKFSLSLSSLSHTHIYIYTHYKQFLLPTGLIVVIIIAFIVYIIAIITMRIKVYARNAQGIIR